MKITHDTIRKAKGRTVSVDASALLEAIDACQQLHDAVKRDFNRLYDQASVSRDMERFEIAVVTLAGSVLADGR